MQSVVLAVQGRSLSYLKSLELIIWRDWYVSSMHRFESSVQESTVLQDTELFCDVPA